MRILFTGASSSTGYWFIRAMVEAGHEVTATFTAHSADDYSGIRRQRLDMLPATVVRKYGCRFGDETMLALLQQQPWDMLCHHGAVVGPSFRDESFDFHAAHLTNTLNAKEMLKALTQSGGKHLMLTGSYLEADEGIRSTPGPALPYGLAKTLTWQTFRYLCQEQGVALGKFVMPNTFGPFEEPLFASYLAKCWLTAVEPAVKTPDVVRDYIPIDLLTASYREAITQLQHQTAGEIRFNPSFWVEANIDFARRMGKQLGTHFGCECPVRVEKSATFNGPQSLQNTQPLSVEKLGWDESKFWKTLADYYIGLYRSKT